MTRNFSPHATGGAAARRRSLLNALVSLIVVLSLAATAIAAPVPDLARAAEPTSRMMQEAGLEALQDADSETDRLPSSAGRLALALGLVGAASLLDEALYEAVRPGSSPTRADFFGTITHLGDGLTALAATAALWPRDPETAELVGRAALRSGLAAVALKAVVTRARPLENPAACAEYRFGLGACVSMPSGHTATAFSVAHVLAHQNPDLGWLWYGLAALAGWSRVETGNHWPSDVAAGAIIGLWAADSVLKQFAGERAGHQGDAGTASRHEAD